MTTRLTNLYLINNDTYVPADNMNEALSIFQERYPDECILECVKVISQKTYCQNEEWANTLLKIN